MTKLLQQALDALIESRDDVDLCYAGVKAARLSFRQERQLGFYEAQLVKHDAAIEALKQALAQQDQPDQQLCSFYQVDSFPALVAAQEQHIQKLQAKLAKPANPFHPLNSRAT